MVDEVTRRRVGFRRGAAIRMADGQEWTFPGLSPGEWDGGLGQDHAALVAAVFEAEDRDDRLRCELALAINLLAANYELSPAEFRAVFGFRPGGPELAAARAGFRALAVEHARSLPLKADPAPAAAGLGDRARGWFRAGGRLWTTRRRPAGSVGLTGGSYRG